MYLIFLRLISNRVIQMALVAAVSTLFVGGYGWYQRVAITSELNRTITVLKDEANDKAEARQRYAKEDEEADNAINSAVEKKDIKIFVDYWNSTNRRGVPSPSKAGD
jgi:hypothetical protein